MKIIYHCYGGSHSSVTAAAIHLKLIPINRFPGIDALRSIPHFDQQTPSDHGTLKLMGIDEFGNHIYFLGRRNSSIVTHNALNGVAQIFGVGPDEVQMIDVMPYVNVLMMIGGYLSRRLGLIKLGRPIVLLGTRLAFYNMVGLVERVRLMSSANLKKLPKQKPIYYDY